MTTLRIAASVCLLLVKPFSPLFYHLYLICGLSDVLDGYFARKLDTSSKRGQALDSIADLIFIGIVLFIYIPVIDLPLWILYWIAAIARIRFISILTGYIRFRQLAFLHTFANKITGILLFFFPLLISVFSNEPAAVFICFIATVSAAEELLINMTSKTLNRDRISLLRK